MKALLKAALVLAFLWFMYVVVVPRTSFTPITDLGKQILQMCP